jgi:hypothetical protein
MVLEDSTSRAIVSVVSHKAIFKVLPGEDEALLVIQDGGQGGGVQQDVMLSDDKSLYAKAVRH